MNTLLRLERCLLPPPETIRWNKGQISIERCTLIQKIVHCVKNFFTFIVLLIVSPFTLIYDYFTRKTVAALPQKAPDIRPAVPQWPPAQTGFATAGLQTGGLGTRWSATPGLDGICDWDEWMAKPGHIAHPEGFDKKNFFTDILTNPDPYIAMLKAQNVNAHRFSLEWSVLEPVPGKPFSPEAIRLYRQFIQKLIDNGITPHITLSHFVFPAWFHNSGGFQKQENIAKYVQFALNAMAIFGNVKDWWSFNELGVKAFQQTREVYPTDVPEGSSLPTRVHAAGIATGNMLIAHCELHKQVKALHPDKKIGVTHQWLKFDTANSNWLERLMAYIFEKFGFAPVYNFFKDGKYSFEFPFMANIHFEIPKEEFEANEKFLMRMGVQAYPKPMMKMGLNHGQTYPGLPTSIKNLPFFSFGSSCEPGGTVMRFGPRWKASGMDECLDEAFALTNNVYITEFGSDAMVHKWGEPGFKPDDAAQANYLQQLTERIRDYILRTGREIKGIFCWSDLRRQMEWENGFECKLAIMDTVVDPITRQFIRGESTPASRYIAGVYGLRIPQPQVQVAG
jgi:beta-glucosidase/6-phospho-beta-glucosidase/beta-galactosidase